jgi:hypothetical protein
VVAASDGTFYGQAMKTGDIYTVAGGGPSSATGNGIPATQADVFFPFGVAVDSAGDVLVSTESLVRMVPAKTGTYFGQAMTAGDIYTVAGDGTDGFSGDGGPATAAELSDPQGLAADGAGNLVISDTGNGRVRVIAAKTGIYYGQAMKPGDIYTVAGNGQQGLSGTGGPAAQAGIATPLDTSVDSAGNLVISDDWVLVVAARTGTYYGQAMTAGDVYRVAWTGVDDTNGDPYFGGDGGPATEAGLHAISAVPDNGGLAVADFPDHRIRYITG